MKNKIIYILSLLLLILASCAQLAEKMWESGESPEFEIKVVSNGDGTVTIQSLASDHLNAGSGSSFKGYYIYRSDADATNPYDNYSQIGIDAKWDNTLATPRLRERYLNEAGNIQPDRDDTNNVNSTLDPTTDPIGGRFVDDCVNGKRYFYRVVAVYQDEDNNKKSNWTLGYCHLYFIPPVFW